MSRLYDLYSNPSIESFGNAFRIAIGVNEDYSSLVELDFVEKEEDFAIALKKFLRRYDSSSKRYERENPGRHSFKPSERDLDEVIKMAHEYGVKIVCAAIISHALVRQRQEGR